MTLTLSRVLTDRARIALDHYGYGTSARTDDAGRVEISFDSKVKGKTYRTTLALVSVEDVSP